MGKKAKSVKDAGIPGKPGPVVMSNKGAFAGLPTDDVIMGHGLMSAMASNNDQSWQDRATAHAISQGFNKLMHQQEKFLGFGGTANTDAASKFGSKIENLRNPV